MQNKALTLFLIFLLPVAILGRQNNMPDKAAEKISVDEGYRRLLAGFESTAMAPSAFYQMLQKEDESSSANFLDSTAAGREPFLLARFRAEAERLGEPEIKPFPASAKINPAMDSTALYKLLKTPNRVEDLEAAAALQNPALRDIKFRFKANRERYDQLAYIEDLIAGYNAFALEPSPGIGPYKNKIMLKKSFPSPAISDLKSGLISLDAGLIKKELQAAFLDIRSKIRQSFYGLYFEIEEIKVEEESLKLRKHLEDLVLVQYNTGSRGLSDLLSTQAAVAKLEAEIESRRDRTKILRAALAFEIGLLPDFALGDPVYAAEKIDFMDSTKLEEAALLNNPRLAVPILKGRKLELMVTLLEKMARPDLSAGASVYQYRAMPRYNQMKMPAFPLVRTPLINHSFAGMEATSRELRAKIPALDQKRKRIEDKIRYQVYEEFRKIRIARRDLDLLDNTLLPLAKDTIEVSESEFVAGRQGLAILLKAHDRLLDYRILRLHKRRDIHLALARLVRIGAWKNDG